MGETKHNKPFVQTNPKDKVPLTSPVTIHLTNGMSFKSDLKSLRSAFREELKQEIYTLIDKKEVRANGEEDEEED